MKERIPFVDWLRAVACFMVMLVHASENFYGVVTEKAIACNICCAVTTKIISLLPGNRRPHWPPVWTLTHCLMSRTHDRAKHTANHSDRHNTRVSQWPVHRCHLSRLSIPYNTSHPGRCILHHSCHTYHRRYNLKRPVYRCWWSQYQRLLRSMSWPPHSEKGELLVPLPIVLVTSFSCHRNKNQLLLIFAAKVRNNWDFFVFSQQICEYDD